MVVVCGVVGEVCVDRYPWMGLDVDVLILGICVQTYMTDCISICACSPDTPAPSLHIRISISISVSVSVSVRVVPCRSVCTDIQISNIEYLFAVNTFFQPYH